MMRPMNELATLEAKEQIGVAISAIEKTTSAELVVMMRPVSGTYRHADLTAGAVSALGYLCLFLYHPEPFDFTYFPVEQAACFVLMTLACARLPWLRRALSGARARRDNVTLAAKGAFFDRGISKTRSRIGVLVYLSFFEREAAVVHDVGLDDAQLGEPFEQACEALRTAARHQGRAEFLSALERLGARLAEIYPIQDDDVDELPNEVAA
jgi:putative membrane protein